MEAELPPGYSLKNREAAADFSRPIRESVDETIFALIFGWSDLARWVRYDIRFPLGSPLILSI